jgi:16S rRNA (uracil1498-N3)-methyltransferase
MVVAAARSPSRIAAVTRFHLRAGAAVGERVSFDADEAHHLARVLRLGPGDLVQAVDGHGHELTVRLTEIGAHGAHGLVMSRTARLTESPLDLTLVQSIVKGDKLESIIRMATELGVCRVAPVITERTIARVAPARWAHRLERWRRVAKEASKQSGRAVIPDVQAPCTLAEWLASPRTPGLVVCFWESEPNGLDAILPRGDVKRATVIVGPEGGFSADEAAQLRAAGSLVAGLGPRILRADTAGPVALALLQSRYGDLGARV